MVGVVLGAVAALLLLLFLLSALDILPLTLTRGEPSTGEVRSSAASSDGHATQAPGTP